MTLNLPRQGQFTRRDDFAAAVSATFEELVELYESEAVGHVVPEWADPRQSVTLPLALANDGGAAHGLAAIMRHAIDGEKSAIGRIARVERDGNWTVFFEAR